jgi:hypothetical protein
LSYFHQKGGGIIKSGICQIGVYPDHVRLAVIHGVFIPDPHHLFEGTQKYKRFVRIESYDLAPWEILSELILSASRFDPKLIKENS